MKNTWNHFKNIRNIHIKHLQIYLWNIGNIQINTFATYVSKTDKTLRTKLTTYVNNHCNIYNISIYFCNIHINICNITLKHLKTDACNMRFQPTSTCCLDENGSSSMRTSTPAWSSMVWSGAEVTDVELVGDTDLDRSTEGGWSAAATIHEMARVTAQGNTTVLHVRSAELALVTRGAGIQARALQQPQWFYSYSILS
jgi:hypothetical protein